MVGLESSPADDDGTTCISSREISSRRAELVSRVRLPCKRRTVAAAVKQRIRMRWMRFMMNGSGGIVAAVVFDEAHGVFTLGALGHGFDDAQRRADAFRASAFAQCRGEGGVELRIGRRAEGRLAFVSLDGEVAVVWQQRAEEPSHDLARLIGRERLAQPGGALVHGVPLPSLAIDETFDHGLAWALLPNQVKAPIQAAALDLGVPG